MSFVFESSRNHLGSSFSGAPRAYQQFSRCEAGSPWFHLLCVRLNLTQLSVLSRQTIGRTGAKDNCRTDAPMMTRTFLSGRLRHLQGALLLNMALTLCCAAGTFQLVSVIDSGQTPPVSGGGDSYAPIISPNGRFVLFASTANNLLSKSNNAPIPLLMPRSLNVFLRDRTNGTVKLASVNVVGAGGGNGDSIPTGLSSDGRYALFESQASDLVLDDTNNA